MFENNMINIPKCNDPVRYSRIITSFYHEGGKIEYDGEFRDWLESLSIPDADIRNILVIANCGNYELEDDARAFIKKYREEHQEE